MASLSQKKKPDESDKNATVVVYIWRPDAKHIGHSALKLREHIEHSALKPREHMGQSALKPSADTYKPSADTYISWWPKTECGASHRRVKADPHTSLREDIAAEGKRDPISYEIQVTDEELKAIKLWWTGFKDKADYQFVSNNCSTVVYYALEAAFPFLSDLNDEVPVWVPETIEMVAQDLKAQDLLAKDLLAKGLTPKKRSIDKKRIKEIKDVALVEAKRIAGGFRGLFVKSKTIGKMGRK